MAGHSQEVLFRARLLVRQPNSDSKERSLGAHRLTRRLSRSLWSRWQQFRLSHGQGESCHGFAISQSTVLSAKTAFSLAASHTLRLHSHTSKRAFFERHLYISNDRCDGQPVRKDRPNKVPSYTNSTPRDLSGCLPETATI